MRKWLTFARRNVLEILRDPLSYLFCLGFPLVMLAVMTVVDRSIPPEANMTLFRIDRLSGGIAVFGQSFVMLFTAINVSKDRAGAFLMRLYASPMTSADFTAGYLLPSVGIALLQSVIVALASAAVALFTGTELSFGGLMLMPAALLPSALLFTALGLLFGTLCGEKSAPGLCSVVISAASFLGGVWFDAESVGGVLYRICRALPFWYAVKTARSAVLLDFSRDAFGIPFLVTLGSAVIAAVLAALVFRGKMRADLG